MPRSTVCPVGAVYTRLTVLALGPMKYMQCGKRRATFVCLCCCGNQVTLMASNVLNGHTQSCGCLQRERTSQANATHRLTRTTEHTIWMNMIQRCLNPKSPAYKDYGGRGILVCERWLDFKYFLEDMGKRPRGLTLERVNNEQGYTPENCVWATRTEQANNRRANRNYKERYGL